MFIEITTKNFILVHGYDENGKELTEDVKVSGYTKKLMAISRIQSITEQYILTTASQDRLIYWEYEGSYDEIYLKIKNAGLII